jgi:hypothetical protein
MQPTYNLGFIIITGIYISESAFSKLLVRLYEHWRVEILRFGHGDMLVNDPPIS